MCLARIFPFALFVALAPMGYSLPRPTWHASCAVTSTAITNGIMTAQ